MIEEMILALAGPKKLSNRLICAPENFLVSSTGFEFEPWVPFKSQQREKHTMRR